MKFLVLNKDGQAATFDFKLPEDGRPGLDGRDGKDGQEGPPGTHGRDGKDGQDGRDGKDGSPGQRGIMGLQGVKGDKGDQGDIGPRGLQGLKGDDGKQGEQGPPGKDSLGGIGYRVRFNTIESRIKALEAGGVGQPGADGAPGAQGAFGGAITVEFSFSTQTIDQDNGDGSIALNSSPQTSATAVRIDNKDVNGVDISALIALFDDSTSAIPGFIRMVKKTDPTKYIFFRNTTVSAGGGTYNNVLVTNYAQSGASPFAAGDRVLVSWDRTGDKGDQGIQGIQGTQGIQGVPGTDGTNGTNGTNGTSGASNIGWLPLATMQFAPVMGTQISSPSLAAANGGLLMPIMVDAPMILNHLSFRSGDSASARAIGWQLYTDSGGNFGAAVPGAGVASHGWTPAAVSTQKSYLNTASPVSLAPGMYWLVFKCVHATNNIILGGVPSGVPGLSQYASIATRSVGVLANTLDLATGWVKTEIWPVIFLNGRVTGQSSGWVP